MDGAEANMDIDAESLPSRYAIARGNHPKKDIPWWLLDPMFWKCFPQLSRITLISSYEVGSVTRGSIFYCPVLLAMNEHLKFPRRKLWFYYEINFPLTQVQKAV